MRVDSRARPSDVGRESTTFKAEQRIGYIIQNVGTNQQASLDPRTRFNGRCFIVEPVGCLHLNDWFHWGERRGGIIPIPQIIDAFSFRFSHFFNTEKLSENSAFISHWNTQGRLFIHWRQTITWRPVSASFFSPKQMPTPFHEIPIIDRQLIKLADPTTSLSINTPANYTVVSPRSIHSSCVVYPCAWIDARPFFLHYRTNCRFTHAHGTEREKGREIERKREREKGKKIGGNSSVLSRLESKSTWQCFPPLISHLTWKQLENPWHPQVRGHLNDPLSPHPRRYSHAWDRGR